MRACVCRTVARRLVRIQLEPGFATLAYLGPVQRTRSTRCWHTVAARANIGLTLEFVRADLPPGIARRHEAAR